MKLHFYKNIDDIDDFKYEDVDEKDVGDTIIASEALGWILDPAEYTEDEYNKLIKIKHDSTADFLTRLLNNY